MIAALCVLGAACVGFVIGLVVMAASVREDRETLRQAEVEGLRQRRTDMHAHLMAELLRRSHGHAARKEYLQ